jgi:hypothetical protein
MPSIAGAIICTAGDSLSRPSHPNKKKTANRASAVEIIIESVIPEIERVMAVKLGVQGRC